MEKVSSRQAIIRLEFSDPETDPFVSLVFLVWRVRSDLVEFQDENEFALKIQSKSDPTMTIETIKRECQVLANLNHPFVVDFVTSYDDEQKFYILMGLIKGCDLWSIIHREIADGEWYSGIPEDSAKFYSIVIVDTLVSRW